MKARKLKKRKGSESEKMLYGPSVVGREVSEANPVRHWGQRRIDHGVSEIGWADIAANTRRA